MARALLLLNRMALFRDRRDAGRKLAQSLSRYRRQPDVIVLALPRGGVPVAFEVARTLEAPLEVFLVRKLGVPGQEELAMGAIASGGVRVLNQDVVHALSIPDEVIDAVADRELRELERRERAYRDQRPAPEVRGRTVILIDDGLATGASVRAAIVALRELKPARLVVAVPTAAPETCAELREMVDDIVCAVTPEPFYGVGFWYEDFSQTSDEEVRALLEQAAARFSPQRGMDGESAMKPNTGEDRSIEVEAGGVTMAGNLAIPRGAEAVVVFAHGSGSSRFSRRNRFVAQVLQDGGMATLLFDLLTAEEEEVDSLSGQFRFDIDLLSDRMISMTDWLRKQPETSAMTIGYFGASTGAAAALVAAADRPESVFAVVSRGGRPDLAIPHLSRVKAPTLLIVGGNDLPVIRLNREALAQIRAEKRVEILPGATHLFEEPGALEEVARLARDWFAEHLPSKKSLRSVTR